MPGWTWVIWMKGKVAWADEEIENGFKYTNVEICGRSYSVRT